MVFLADIFKLYSGKAMRDLVSLWLLQRFSQYGMVLDMFYVLTHNMLYVMTKFHVNICCMW